MAGLSAAGGSEDDPPKDGVVIETAMREAMGRQHVSLSRLARDAHVQRATLYAWFNGQRPEPDTWDRVASRLDLPPLVDLLARHRTTETPDLAAAVIRLTDELAAMRQEREAWTRGVVEVLRAYAAGQVPTDLLDALAPQPPVDAQP